MKIKFILSLLMLCLITLSFTFCNKPAPYSAKLTDSPMKPVLPEAPYDYPASDNDYLASLGRVLFFDKELSINKNISCGSCHKQENAFCDNKQFSKGTYNLLTKRNSPSIFAKNSRLFWDGRSTHMEDLVFRPVKDEVEMSIHDVQTMIQRINSIDYYAYIFPYAFPNYKKIDSGMIKRALAEFLMNFNFSDTKFSRSRKGLETLTASESIGKDLFFGKAKCSQCHHIENDNFNNPNQNSGYGSTEESHNIGLSTVITDRGVGAITGNSHEEGAFMMPVLLNVEFTAPYMHDGSLKTLEEVIDHYDHNVKSNPNLDFRLTNNFSVGGSPQNLHLSTAEKKGLVDFLKTLSDPSILTDERFSDPFVPR
jgi:cytochrome c peroxidase